MRGIVMRRPVRRALASLAALSAVLAGVAAHAAAAQVWYFADSPTYPGVRLLEIGEDGATVTSDWYGTMPAQNVRRNAQGFEFDLGNLNDNARPVRHWVAAVQGDQLTLTGDIWTSHVVQSARPATPQEQKRYRFTPTSLPPLTDLAVDGQAATPPMGWSSWNRFAENIDDKTVREIADAMVATGLRDAGYTYVNIDDGWQGERGADGILRPNAKFPDMKGLADYVHARGLKLGIYSSPGPKTCAGFTGSYGHVAQDARTFAAWGVDYLKYDLCSGEWFYRSQDEVRRGYQEMGAALKATGRSIVYSLCEYGRVDVATWGRKAGGHLWRTTGDITDDFASMTAIGLDRNPRFPAGGPGGWNDPDMLEVGNGGMSAVEYRAHMALWAMSSAPLLMGHDVRAMSAETKEILENKDVIAIDQDRLGVPGHRLRSAGQAEVWSRPLADGGHALALFNRGEQAVTLHLTPAETAQQTMALDVWAQRRVSTGDGFVLPAHGSVLLRFATGLGVSAD